MLFDVLHQSLYPAFKLPAELRAGHQSGQVQHIHFLLGDLGGHLALHDALGDALGDGGFAHTRFTDQAGVILGAAVQNLHHPVDLLFPPDDNIHFAFSRLAGQVLAVVFQIFILGGALFRLFAAGIFGRRLGALLLLPVHQPAEQVLHKGERHGAAFFKAVLAVLGHFAHDLHHLVAYLIQVLLGEPHLFHQVIHGLEPQLLGALQAQPLADGLSVFHPGHINDRQPLFAAGAKHIVFIHLVVPLPFVGRSLRFVTGQSPILLCPFPGRIYTGNSNCTNQLSSVDFCTTAVFSQLQPFSLKVMSTVTAMPMR